MAYYDKHFYDWYENIYLKAKEDAVIAARKSLAKRKRKIAKLEKDIADKQNLLEHLKAKDIMSYMEIIALKLRQYKESSNLTNKQIGKAMNVPEYIIFKHCHNEFKYTSKYTKAIEKYLNSTV
jgi:hypothetical protein